MKNRSKIKLEEYYNPTPITAYILGLLWADGSIYTKKDKKWIAKMTEISLKESDGKTVKKLFSEYSFSIKKNKKNLFTDKAENSYVWKTSCHALYDFLNEKDYKYKTGKSPKLILDFLSPKLKRYWLLGYFNGDGAILKRKDRKGGYISFGSSKDQDWSFLVEICDKLKIHYKISINKLKYGYNSEFRIYRQESLIKFGKYLFKYYNKELGFQRKYKVWNKIIKSAYL